MLSPFTIDQLVCFITAAEAQSFSAAGRRLGRAQSVVSQAIADLEARLHVPLFSRAGRTPKLTPAGTVLLADARVVIASLDALKARARGMAAGLEPELIVAMDVMFPMAILTCTAAAFGQEFPNTPLRLYVEALGGVSKAVQDGQCSLGVVSMIPSAPGLITERLTEINLIYTAAPSHPLAQLPGPLQACELARHVQLVLTDRTEVTAGSDFGVVSPRTWRLADLGAKHEFLRAGLGWGGMPEAMIAADLAAGNLVRLPVLSSTKLAMAAAYRPDAPPGPAGRWFIERLRAEAGGAAAVTPPARAAI
jgi:DNA-binding transcriptional LysR family regulator